jgi:hypothetical protein
MQTKYPWIRYWCPRNAAYVQDGRGFVAVPSTSPFLLRNNHLKTIESLLNVPCLILLGENGIGTTDQLQRMISLAAEKGDHCVSVDLCSVKSPFF